MSPILLPDSPKVAKPEPPASAGEVRAADDQALRRAIARRQPSVESILEASRALGRKPGHGCGAGWRSKSAWAGISWMSTRRACPSTLLRRKFEEGAAL